MRPVFERVAEGHAQRERQREPGDGPDHERAVHEAHDRVLEQVRRVAALGAPLGVDEEPADVRVGEAAQRAAQAAAVAHVRAVGVALLIGEGVVLAVVRHPRDHGPLDGGRAERGEGEAQPRLGREAAVGEQAVEADGDAESEENVEGNEDQQVAPVERLLPQLPGHQAEGEHGDCRDERRDDAVAPLVSGRLDVIPSEGYCGHTILLVGARSLVLLWGQVPEPRLLAGRSLMRRPALRSPDRLILGAGWAL